ncbi:fimbrillin family protein [Prevotella herbatica]|uniref:receptor protein-tyrosine kinase n=1 Tax=Prevotella herbatica TaxID=2801997 RepID=A0ABN6EIZ0_9BACT|nr:fimbrillin family protein [Prevotella herbatica]BCS85838.1 fimbrillin family protein [Prevotella herbatica]
MVKKYLRGINVSFLLLIIISTFSSCANEMNILDGNNNEQINFSVSVPEWKNNDNNSNQDSRATPISGTSLGTSSTFNMIADVNNGSNSYGTIINNEAVSFINSMWQTTIPHYWSGITNKTVNFYAYYPTSISSNISYAAGSVPTLSYTVPNDAVNQIDIMTATANNVNGNTNSSTSLTFSHIFAAVQFSIGSAGMPTGTITGITLNNILYKGVYNFNGTWIQDATSKTSFSQTVLVPTNAGTSITSGTLIFMMMPQTLGSDASIIVTYSNGGTLTKSISGVWTAGNIYTYNISKTISVANFDYTGNMQSYTIPLNGTYKIECWGAQGGPNGCKGGYTSGEIKQTEGSVLYIYVGQKGQTCPGFSTGGAGWNGGGNANTTASTAATRGGGGGATDIRTISGIWNNSNSLKSRIMVAGGGGGIGQSYYALYGYAGGISGGYIGSIGPAGKGGTQLLGGAGGYDSKYGTAFSGGFGYGGQGLAFGSGGGGGYYGGGGGVQSDSGDGAGGGGSSYISGHSDCAVYSLIYTFSKTIIIDGNTSMPSPSGGTETGHTGNGYARITFVSAN